MAELYFAPAKLSAIQVPLNAFLKGEFLRYQLADCTATVLGADSAGIAAALALLDQLAGLTGIVCLDESDGLDAALPRLKVTRYAELRQSTSALPVVDVSATQLMSIVYTSGTTGFPKGCMLPHGYYLRCGQVMVDTVELTDDDVLLTAMPLFHGACRMLLLAAGLIRGIEVCIEPEFRASTFLYRAAEVGATFALGVGAMGTALLAQPSGRVDPAHRLRAFMLIPFPPDRQEQFRTRFGVDAWAEAYGQTECVPVTCNRLSGDRSAPSCGRPAPDLDVALLDDDDTEVSTGQVAEICVRPRTPFSMYVGYWRKPEATLGAFSTLWYHTGDYGRRDHDGFISFVDRKKDAVRRRGENVSTVELENAIVTHPEIAEVAVHAVPTEATEATSGPAWCLRQERTSIRTLYFRFFGSAFPISRSRAMWSSSTSCPRTPSAG